jgi:hypothetical protein
MKKAWSVIGLLFVAAIFATVPISPQVTPRGVELRVDQAQAITYGRYRRVTRRAYRRAGYAAAAGYGVTAAGYYGGAGYGYGGPGYAAAGYGPVAAGYGYGGAAYGYHVEPAGYGRWCAVYPSGFRWCWTEVASAYGPTGALNPQPLPPAPSAAVNPQPLPPAR